MQNSLPVRRAQMVHTDGLATTAAVMDDAKVPPLLTQADMEDNLDKDDSDKDDKDDKDNEDNNNEKQPDDGLDTAETTLEELLLLIDAANSFNKLSRYGILWTVRHRYTKLSSILFNCYHHEIILVCRQPGEDTIYILSKEGVT